MSLEMNRGYRSSGVGESVMIHNPNFFPMVIRGGSIFMAQFKNRFYGLILAKLI